jgi:hypothetical protein
MKHATRRQSWYHGLPDGNKSLLGRERKTCRAAAAEEHEQEHEGAEEQSVVKPQSNILNLPGATTRRSRTLVKPAQTER